MSKNITVRLENDVYLMIKQAADGAKRNISNFLECAALNYLSQEAIVSDREMDEILGDKQVLSHLKAANKDIKQGKYRIVE